MSKLQIEERHYQLISEILNRFQLKAFVFGSRAKGTAKKFSDLDLLIKEPVENRILNQIKNAFEESNLPYKVDVVLWDKIDDSFKQHIKNDLIEF